MKHIKTDKKQDLVPVIEAEIGGVLQAAVDGRTLHMAMGVKSTFADWMTRRIKKYEFVEGLHYQVHVFLNSEKNPGGRPTTEYTLTLHTAKELSMVEPGKMGAAVRSYFIECEKKLLNSRVQDQSDTELSDQEKREKQENIAISQMIRDRVFYWVLDKRDKIYRADMDRDILFSITLDIEQSITRDFNDDFQYFLDNALENNLDLSFSDFVKFIKNWKPYYIMEKILRHKQ